MGKLVIIILFGRKANRDWRFVVEKSRTHSFTVLHPLFYGITMKKTLSIFGALAVVAAALAFNGTVLAATVTPDEALIRLQSDREFRSSKLGRNRSGLRYDQTIGNLYIFSSDKGFAILPNQDSAPALLGYSDDGVLDPQSNAALADWLEFYNSQLELLKERKLEYVTTKQNPSPLRAGREEIAPLIKTEWNQEAPYNLLCPKVDGRETVTGCVATAMAQAMKYYDYPAHGTGTHSYFWRPGEEELTFDYANTPFEWSLMTDTYDSKSSEESKHAVAELMLACGVSVDMHYEPGESGAATMAMGSSLIDIFGYSPSLWMPDRVFYGIDEWEEMIYQELKEGSPVLYSGAGTAGGHQFICDGYSAGGYFHFNWGWGGLSNGYFLLNALNPDDLGVGGGAGGFNTSQVATLGFRLPEDGDKPVYVFYNTIGFTTDVTTVHAGEAFRCGGQYFNYSLYTMPEGSRLGMKFVEEGGSDGCYVEGPEVAGFHPNDGRYDLQVEFPDLPDGTYRITPALKVDGKWLVVRMPVGYADAVTAVVNDKTATISNAPSAVIKVCDIALPAAIYRDHEFPMTFKVENTSDLEYYGRVTPVLLDESGKVVAESKFRPVDVTAHSDERIADYIADFSAKAGEEFSEGVYSLVFRDSQGNAVSEPIEVEVRTMTDATEFKVTDFKLAQENPVTNPKEVRFTYTLTCESGVFFSGMELLLFPGAGGDELYHKGIEAVYLTAGEKHEGEVVADLSDIKDGEYIALIYSGGEPRTDRVYFRIKRDITGLFELIDGPANSASDPSCVPAYDLLGRRVNASEARGIIILPARKILR